MSIRIIISDLTLTGHPESVRNAISVGYGSDISAQCEINVDGLSSALARAVEVGAEAVIRSTTGVNNYISLAQGYYNNHGIQTIMPLGSNSFVELSVPTEVPVIITCGAGDEELRNNTGYGDGLEFWDWDLSQTDPPTSDQSSYSTGIILGKLLKIKDDLSCSWWEARYRARMTCSREESNRETSPWGKYNGYGRPDIISAEAYSGEIISDPYYIPPPPEQADPPVISYQQNYLNTTVSGITFTPDKSTGSYRYKYNDEEWIEISATTIPDRTLTEGYHTLYVQEYWNSVWSESGIAIFSIELENADSPVITCESTFRYSEDVSITFTPDKNSGIYRYKFDSEDWSDLDIETIPYTSLSDGLHTIYVQEYWNGVWSESGVKTFEIIGDKIMSGWKNGVFYPGDNPAMAYESGSGAPASLLPENVIYKDTATGDLYMNVDGVNKKYLDDSSLVKEIVWDVDLPTSGGALLSATLIANTTEYDGLSIVDKTVGPNLALEFKGPAEDLTDRLRGMSVIGRSIIGGIAGVKAVPNPPSYSFDSGLYITKCTILLYDSSDVMFTTWPDYAVRLLLRFKLYP